MQKTFTLILLAIVAPFILTAQWNGTPAAPGTAIANTSRDDQRHLSVSDGSGGAIVVFQSDLFNNSTYDYETRIHVQRITSTGTTPWAPSSNPKAITGIGDFYMSQVIADGSGGAFIAYEDYTTDNGQVILQRINNLGNIMWTAGGINVSNNLSRDNYGARLITDGTGGVFVAWTSEIYDAVNRLEVYLQAFAQRINSAGVVQWAAGGVQLSIASGFRGFPDIVTDGAGGLIALFADTRNSAYLPGADHEFPNLDIYAQRLNAAGARLWTNDGKDVCTEVNIQYISPYRNQQAAVSDGAGGAIVVFQDSRIGNTAPEDLYTQRIDGNGNKMWNGAGVFVCVAAGDQYLSQVVSNGAQGATAMWTDERSASGDRIYAQQLNAAGTTLWTTNGVLLSGSTEDIWYDADLESDGLGGFIATWGLYPFPSGGLGSIKAQKVNSSGLVQWTTGGITVYSNTDNNYVSNMQVTISDGGRAIVSWDESLTTSTDIFAKKLEVNGVLPLTLVDFNATLVQDNVLVRWITANEQNVLSFVVERSTDNNNFQPIGTVAATGGSATNRTYQFIDEVPVDGANFYRLKQKEKDGTFTYTSVKLVNITDARNLTARLMGNPVSSSAIVSIKSPVNQPVEIHLINSSGQRLISQRHSLAAGTQQISIPMAQLPKGNYTITVMAKGNYIKLPILKL